MRWTVDHDTITIRLDHDEAARLRSQLDGLHQPDVDVLRHALDTRAMTTSLIRCEYPFCHATGLIDTNINIRPGRQPSGWGSDPNTIRCPNHRPPSP